MDLATYNDGRIGVDAFINTLSKNEYRNVFYFRIPWILRVFLNIFLRRVPDCKLQCAHCGGALNVHHGWGTIVLADRIGENFSVYQNVTVGYGKDGKPSIGNHVSIYSGAVVFGNITIGNHGANRYTRWLACLWQSGSDCKSKIIYGTKTENPLLGCH